MGASAMAHEDNARWVNTNCAGLPHKRLNRCANIFGLLFDSDMRDQAIAGRGEDSVGTGEMLGLCLDILSVAHRPSAAMHKKHYGQVVHRVLGSVDVDLLAGVCAVDNRTDCPA